MRFMSRQLIGMPAKLKSSHESRLQRLFVDLQLFLGRCPRLAVKLRRRRENTQMWNRPYSPRRRRSNAPGVRVPMLPCAESTIHGASAKLGVSLAATVRCVRPRQRRTIIVAWGNAPGMGKEKDRLALKARFSFAQTSLSSASCPSPSATSFCMSSSAPRIVNRGLIRTSGTVCMHIYRPFAGTSAPPSCTLVAFPIMFTSLQTCRGFFTRSTRRAHKEGVLQMGENAGWPVSRIFLAARIWRVFSQSEPARGGPTIHQRSTGTPSRSDVSGGIPRIVAKSRHRFRRALYVGLSQELAVNR